MQIDLKADFLSHILDELKTLEVAPPPSNDLTECALLLFKLQRRCPEPRQRQTLCSTTFTLPDELRAGFKLLCEAIHRGDSLRPYLSRDTLKAGRSDKLLDDWGILHLHMGERLQPNGLIEGTQIVAFALVRDECVYFIDALPHGRGYPDTWVQEQLIHIIDHNWPELLPSNLSQITPDMLSPEARRNLRRSRANATVTKPSGGVIGPPGGGFMADGTAIADLTRLERMHAYLASLETLYRQSEPEIRAALGRPDGVIHLRGRFVGQQVLLYEVFSGKGLNLVVQPASL